MNTPATYTTGSIAAYLGERLGSGGGGVELTGRADLPITHLDTLERATPGAMTFIRSRGYASDWAASRATAALVSRGVEVKGHDSSSRAVICVPDADLALNAVLDLMAPKNLTRASGVHPSAVVDGSASVGAGVSVGPHCTVESGAIVGDGTVLVANVYLGHDVRVGRGCLLYPGVCVLNRCVLGDGCILHSGVVIGADGFGYRPAEDGRGMVKIPHIGIVEIGKGVEIGANTCIDRAKFGATTVGDGTKIDNLVQIGHGCRIGRSCILCGQVGLAGSSEVGDGAMLGGQSGVGDNIKVGRRAMVAGKAGIMKDMPDGESWFGMPAYDAAMVYRDTVTLRRLARHIQELRAQGLDPYAAFTGQSRKPTQHEP